MKHGSGTVGKHMLLKLGDEFAFQVASNAFVFWFVCFFGKAYYRAVELWGCRSLRSFIALPPCHRNSRVFCLQVASILMKFKLQTEWDGIYFSWLCIALSLDTVVARVFFIFFVYFPQTICAVNSFPLPKMISEGVATQRCVAFHSCVRQPAARVQSKQNAICLLHSCVALCDLEAGGRCDVNKFNP